MGFLPSRRDEIGNEIVPEGTSDDCSLRNLSQDVATTCSVAA
jgi:hypothetical protein